MRLRLATLILISFFAGRVHAQSGAFITQWNTALDTTSDGLSIAFNGSGTNFSISVGGLDRNYTATLTGSGFVNIPVPKKGSYTVMIQAGSGTFYGYSNYSGGSGTPVTDARDCLTAITQWGTTQFTKMNFNSADNLDITATDIPDLSHMIDMQESFAYCFSLRGNASIKNWDVSHVQVMTSMFQGDQHFDYDLSAWNLASIGSVAQMFSYTGMSKCNYTRTLNGWAANPNIPSEVFAKSQDAMKYADTSGRSFLVNQKGWRIDGDEYEAGSCSASEASGARFGSTGASTTGNQMTVTWETGSETGVDRFLIETGSDSAHFKTVDSVASKAPDGNSGTTLSYSATINAETINSVLATLWMFGLACLPLLFRKKRVILVGCYLCLIGFGSCKKNSQPDPTPSGSAKTVYLRITSVNKDGSQTHSAVMRVKIPG